MGELEDLLSVYAPPPAQHAMAEWVGIGAICLLGLAFVGLTMRKPVSIESVTSTESPSLAIVYLSARSEDWGKIANVLQRKSIPLINPFEGFLAQLDEALGETQRHHVRVCVTLLSGLIAQGSVRVQHSLREHRGPLVVVLGSIAQYR
jgi:hypothetical protein